MNQICFMFRIRKSLFTLFSSRLIIMSWAWCEGSPISPQPIWACVTYFSLSQDYEFQKSIFSASLAWLVLRSVWATTMNSGLTSIYALLFIFIMPSRARAAAIFIQLLAWLTQSQRFDAYTIMRMGVVYRYTQYYTLYNESESVDHPWRLVFSVLAWFFTNLIRTHCQN